MKAIIPVAGAGTQLRPHTYTQPKPLIPVAGKPIVAFIIDQLVDAGINDFIFIIGHLGEKIKKNIEERYPNLRKTFVTQSERLGIAHAIWVARETFAHADEILIVLGDTIFDDGIAEMLADEHSCLGIKKVTEPREFGIAEVTDKGQVIRVIEKPKIPISNLALVGVYKIKEVSQLLEAIQYLLDHNLKTHNEFQLTDALMHLIERGVYFNAVRIKSWFDCGKRDILLETNATLLKKYPPEQQPRPTFPNTIIIPPVSIGNDCNIADSIIGPFVSVGNRATIRHAIIKDSIIGDFSTIQDVILNRSVVGSDASIKGLSQTLNIGDNTEIDFG